MSVLSEIRRGLEGFDLWPAEVPGRGPRRVGRFTRCGRCLASAHLAEAGTFVSYGDVAMCLPHARAAASVGVDENHRGRS